MRDRDVIFSTVRPGRRSYAQILEPALETVVSTGFAVMTPRDEIGASLLATVAGSSDFAGYLESVAQGSAYPAVSVEAMGRYQVEVPVEVRVVAELDSNAMGLRRRARQSTSQSRHLAALRDALLPELLSGRIRVPEARDAVEGAPV